MLKQFDLLRETVEPYIILLDACRYDYYREENILAGRLQECYSMACKTTDFFRKMLFSELDFSEYFYLSGGVMPYSKQNFKRFDKIRQVDLYKSLDKVLEVIEREDRVFLHIYCPHLPWQCEEGLEELKRFKYFSPERSKPRHMTWEEVIYPDVGIRRVKRFYRYNVRYALKFVKELPLKGRSVITADHGELLGEQDRYGHFFNCNTPIGKHPKLREVPWFIWR